MKALTLRQPWAGLIVSGAKRIETRSWATRYRGPLAIHASASGMAPEEQALIAEYPFRIGLLTLLPESYDKVTWLTQERAITSVLDQQRGCVVATCQLVDCFRTEGPWPAAAIARMAMAMPPEEYFGDWTSGRWGWLLEDVVVLPDPVPAKGRLQLWDWEPA